MELLYCENRIRGREWLCTSIQNTIFLPEKKKLHFLEGKFLLGLCQLPLCINAKLWHPESVAILVTKVFHSIFLQTLELGCAVT